MVEAFFKYWSFEHFTYTDNAFRVCSCVCVEGEGGEGVKSILGFFFWVILGSVFKVIILNKNIFGGIATIWTKRCKGLARNLLSILSHASRVVRTLFWCFLFTRQFVPYLKYIAVCNSYPICGSDICWHLACRYTFLQLTSVESLVLMVTVSIAWERHSSHLID